MNSRKYKTDPALLLQTGKEIMATSDGSRFYFRVFAVNMVLSGSLASHVAQMANVSRATVTAWVRAVDQYGFDALKPKPLPGRPRKLSEEQRASIDAALQSDPKDYGFKVWDGPSLSAYIKAQFGVTVSVRQCQRLFHELGYSHIRPQPYPSKGCENSAEREEFKKKLLT
jgi:transposase